MGQSGATTQPTTSIWLPAFGIIIAVLICIRVIGIVGVAYYLLNPQIRLGATRPIVAVNQPSVKGTDNLNALIQLPKH